MREFNDRGFNKADKVGKIGEEYYRRLLQSLEDAGKINGFLDLTKSALCRLADIDFVVFTGPKRYSIEEVEEKILYKDSDGCTFIDVKTDTVTLNSKKFYLEWLAHSGPGCLGCTRANKWVYYAIDSEKMEDVKEVKCWVIDIKKIRSTIESNGLVRDKDYFEYWSKKEKSENYAWLVDIQSLIDKGIAKEIKL